MSETNDMNGRRLPRGFAADISTDLTAGRAVELAEVYALDAVSDVERRAIDERAVSNAEAPVDTTGRTVGIALGVLVAGILLALLLWWRREQPAT